MISRQRNGVEAGSGRAAALVWIVLSLALWARLEAGPPALELPIGDPDRRGRTAELVLDAITDARTGELIDPDELAARLGDRRLVLVGENHTDMDFHRVQLRLIDALRRAGRRVLIGLEMVPFTRQAALDHWVAGRYTEEGFLELAGWYEIWGAHWNYYREIFLYAREHGLGMYGLNTPRQIIAAVRTRGLDRLSATERAQLPPDVDEDSEEHLRLFKALLMGDEDEDDAGFHAAMTDEQWRGMFAAQCAWDATFGHNALRVLEAADDPQAVLVVLVGSGHVAYDLGIQRQVARWADLPMASVIPVPVRDDEGEPIVAVQASYADFLWGLPPEEDPLYPTLGVSTPSSDAADLRAIFVAEGSVGERAGIESGDVLLALGGHPLADQADLRSRIAQLRWGDRTTIRVRRGETELDLTVTFRRHLDEPGEEE